MLRKVSGGPANPSHITGVDQAAFLGEEQIILAGAGVACTLPPSTNRFILAAEGGDVRFRFNEAAMATSPGYVAQNGSIDLALNPMMPLSVYGGAGAIANLMYFYQPKAP